MSDSEDNEKRIKKCVSKEVNNVHFNMLINVLQDIKLQHRHNNVEMSPNQRILSHTTLFLLK